MSAMDAAIAAYTNKTDEASSFRQLLLEKGVTTTMSFEEAARLIAYDDRYNTVKSTAEKKAILQEWQNDRRRQERDEKRQAEKRVRDDFKSMLRDNRVLTVTARFKDIVSMFEADSRWRALPDTDRRPMFEEYMLELEKKEKEAARIVRRENMTRLMEYLKSSGVATWDMPWRKVQEVLGSNPYFQGLNKADRLLVFEDYVKEIDRKMQEERQRDRDLVRREARKARDAFRDMLTAAVAADQINARTRWHPFVATISENPVYTNLLGYPGSTPRDLFEDVIDELKEQLAKDAESLKKAMLDVGFRVTQQTNLEQFVSYFKGHALFDTIDPRNHALLLSELQEQIVKQQQREERRQKRASRGLLKYLRRSKAVDWKSLPYEEVAVKLAEVPEFTSVAVDARPAVFAEFVKQDGEGSDDDKASSSSDEGGDSKSKKSRERTRDRERDYDQDGGDRTQEREKSRERRERTDVRKRSHSPEGSRHSSSKHRSSSRKHRDGDSGSDGERR